MKEEQKYQLWLKSVIGIDNKSLKYLLSYFTNAKNVFYAEEKDILNLRGINKKIINNIIKNRTKENIEKNLKNLYSNNIEFVNIEDDEYPSNLKNIYFPPYALYKKGRILSKDSNSVAIVGARKATSYGKWVAYNLAGEFAKRGITVVSGMAYGIDTAAHKGALDNNGRTIAVLGCGLDSCYPKSNLELMKKIIKNGAVVSEYEIGTKPLAYNFPVRNRIISGISKGVIVVEASYKSGSLITAEYALEQGREVFAVPGNINSTLSQGTNKLIKEGAVLVTSIEDIIQEIDLEIYCSNTLKNNIELSLSEEEVYNIILDNQPIHIDLLFNKLNKKISEVNTIITILQLKGLIDQLPGKLLITK